MKINIIRQVWRSILCQSIVEGSRGLTMVRGRFGSGVGRRRGGGGGGHLNNRVRVCVGFAPLQIVQHNKKRLSLILTSDIFIDVENG